FMSIASDVESGLAFLHADGYRQLFEALRFTLDPDLMISEWKRFMTNMITADGAAPFADGGGGKRYPNAWHGHDEFERASTSTAFFELYRQPFLDWAPTLPERIGTRRYYQLGEYDMQAGGFPLVADRDVQHFKLPPGLKPFVPATMAEQVEYRRSVDWES